MEVQTVIPLASGQLPGVRSCYSSGGSPIDIVLCKAITAKIADLLRDNVLEATGRQSSLHHRLTNREIELNCRRTYAPDLNGYTVGNGIKIAVDGTTGSQFNSGNDGVHIPLILADADMNSLPAIDGIFFRNAITGAAVALSNFAPCKEETGPTTIGCEDQNRVIHITTGCRAITKLTDVASRMANLTKPEVPAEITLSSPTNLEQGTL
jgi:multidrug efflux pump subunit AcrB